MWRRLENGEYTHILLGPEQATHHRFLRILRSARFNQGLAFIAVDELHMVCALRYSRSLVKLSAPEHTPDEKGGNFVRIKSHDFHVI